MNRQVLVGLAIAILACAGACSGPPSSSQASGAQAAGSTTTQSADIASKIHACQNVADHCSNDCDGDRQRCAARSGSSPPPQSCNDEDIACSDTCSKQFVQCSQ